MGGRQMTNFEGKRYRFDFFLDRIYRIDYIFFTCGDKPFGRRPLYPDDPVRLFFKDKNPFLQYSITGFKGDWL